MKKHLLWTVIPLFMVATIGVTAPAAWGQGYATVTDPVTGNPLPGFSNAYYNPGDLYSQVYDGINHVWVTVFLVTGPDGTVRAYLPDGYFEGFTSPLNKGDGPHPPTSTLKCTDNGCSPCLSPIV